MRKVYLDHNATSPIRPEVREAMLPYLGEKFGNPSSLHWAGRDVAPAVMEARASVAALVGADPSEIVFTAGGSEGDNMALMGVALTCLGKGCHIITSAVEHAAVASTVKTLEMLGAEVTSVPVTTGGYVEPGAVRKAMRDNTRLVSVMYANNETGVINPIVEIAAIAREGGALMHTDAVQAVGKVPINVRALGVDMLTASGHKFNALKGVGFQYIKNGLELVPLISGGHQEHGRRAGTENVAGIVGLGAAARAAMADMHERPARIGALRDRLETGILAAVPHTRVNGDRGRRVYNTTNITIKYIEAEALLMMLSAEGIAISTGSACSSGDDAPSPILSAMGVDAVCARGTVRLSLGHGITNEDIDYCLDAIVRIARRLQSMSPFLPK